MTKMTMLWYHHIYNLTKTILWAALGGAAAVALGAAACPTYSTNGDSNLDSDNNNVQTAPTSTCVTLTDPDLLNCPICFQPLASRIFQCTNGHVMCESCCTKMRYTCGACRLSIGRDSRCRALEKILESFRFSCNKNGCKKSLTYIKKCDHEKRCGNTRCRCPHFHCNYVGSSKCLYMHALCLTTPNI